MLAVCMAATAAPRAKAKALKCASPAEVSAMQASAVQQELMVAALACGDAAHSNYPARDNYNAFQTRFAPELRAMDKLMLQMFGRVIGGRKGDNAYNLFKTELAAKAELRRTHNHEDFCQEANLVVAAALGPSKIQLTDFVADIPAVDIAGPVDRCSVEITVTLQGAKAVGIVPKPNPLRLAGPAAATPTP